MIRKRAFIFVLSINPLHAVLELLEQYGWPETCASKWLFLSPFIFTFSWMKSLSNWNHFIDLLWKSKDLFIEQYKRRKLKNPLMPDVHKKGHKYLNKPELKAASWVKYVWPWRFYIWDRMSASAISICTVHGFYYKRLLCETDFGAKIC